MNKLESFLNKHIYGRVFKRAETQSVANNTVWIMLDRLIRIFFGMITGIWVARYLGPTLFGQLSYINTYCMLFVPIATLSIDALIVKELGMFPKNKDSILGTTFSIRLIASFVALVISICTILLLKSNQNDIFLMVFILSSCYLFQSFDVIDLFFQSTLKSKYSMYIRTFVFVLLSLVKLFLIHINAPLISFIWAYAIEISAGSLGLIVMYYYRKELISNWKVDWKLAKYFVSNSAITILQSYALLSQTKLDQIILGQYLGDNELGQYSVAMRMIDILSFVPMAIYASYAPKLAESIHRGKEVYQSKLANFYRIMFYLALAAAIPILLIGKNVITFAFGSEYVLAGIIFSYSGVRILSANMVVAKNTYLVNENMLKHSLYCLLVSATISVSLNILLIPRLNSFGAILANIAGFLIGFFLVDLFYKKTRENLVFMGKSIFFIEK